MNKFEDRLIGDLMEQHGPALAQLRRPEPSKRRHRPLWLSGAAAVVIGAAIATSVTLAGGGGTPAYALTQNPNGTVTLTLSDMTGIIGANAELRKLGLPVLVVPFGQHCPDEAPFDIGHGNLTFERGQFTFSLTVIPAGDTLVVAAQPVTITQGVPMPPKGGLRVIEMSVQLAKGRPTAC
ncbi:MAG TPA: hypothetical protein VHZ97_13150 [Pseudonocardiaceae bacterium]|jgi:hypothetical protein|nr:hypothetical protein [Pseudonocardiaceae bacterium]